MGIDILLDNVKRDAISKFDTTKPADDIFKALGLIYRLATVLRKEGLLSLEETVYSLAGDMLDDVITGIQLFVSSTEPELLTELLTNEYWRDKRQGNEALVKYILLRGILLFQPNVNPYVCQDILLATLPQQLHPAYKEYFDKHREEWNVEDEVALKTRYENWNERKLDKAEINEIVKEVETKLVGLDNKSVQRVLRDIKNEDLSIVMAALSEECRNKIFKNVSERCKIILMEELMSVSDYGECYVLDAAKKMADIIEQLEYTGEILFVLA